MIKRFNGPVYPISPSFDENENLELESTKKYLTHLKDGGAKIVMTTAGTSQFNLMSREVEWVVHMNTANLYLKD
jgi:dihydrodipicolinate synthase/N-acetylneuraminate lyase